MVFTQCRRVTRICSNGMSSGYHESSARDASASLKKSGRIVMPRQHDSKDTALAELGF